MRRGARIESRKGEAVKKCPNKSEKVSWRQRTKRGSDVRIIGMTGWNKRSSKMTV